MKVIKLDAIDSTNDFLKSLSAKQNVENFTVVTAKTQTKGKGQMGSEWVTESGKNLIMSILVKDFLLETKAIFNLNIAVSMAVINALEEFKIPNLSIKWPNDILSDTKKIGGILIENSLKSDSSIISIVGLGLNVNQTNFENLPKASSLAIVCNAKFDKEILLFKIIEYLEQNILLWNQKYVMLWNEYAEKLFKKGIPMPFQDVNQIHFMGIIQGIAANGKLLVLLEDDTVKEYDIKEIQMLY